MKKPFCHKNRNCSNRTEPWSSSSVRPSSPTQLTLLHHHHHHIIVILLFHHCIHWQRFREVKRKVSTKTNENNFMFVTTRLVLRFRTQLNSLLLSPSLPLSTCYHSCFCFHFWVHPFCTRAHFCENLWWFLFRFHRDAQWTYEGSYCNHPLCSRCCLYPSLWFSPCVSNEWN